MAVTFREKNAEGIDTEDRALDLLCSRGNVITYRAEGYFPDYDAIALTKSNKEYKIEIKRDNYDNDKVAIEFEYKGIPSGISTSKSDFFFVEKSITGRFYYIDTMLLKDFIEYYEYKPVSCNDNTDTPTRCYLVHLSLFKPIESAAS